MSSEVSQLCLEALTPLAEQCAKAQDTDSPLLVATRHFLKVRAFVYYIIGIQFCTKGGKCLPILCHFSWSLTCLFYKNTIRK